MRLGSVRCWLEKRLSGAWVLRIVGVLATLAVVWLAGRAARKALADQEADL